MSRIPGISSPSQAAVAALKTRPSLDEVVKWLREKRTSEPPTTSVIIARLEAELRGIDIIHQLETTNDIWQLTLGVRYLIGNKAANAQEKGTILQNVSDNFKTLDKFFLDKATGKI